MSRFKYHNERQCNITIPLICDHKNRTALCKNFYGNQVLHYEQNNPVLDFEPYGIQFPVLNTKLVYGYKIEPSRYVYYSQDNPPLYIPNYQGINRCISDIFYSTAVNSTPRLGDEIDVFADQGRTIYGAYSDWFDEESPSGLSFVGESGIICYLSGTTNKTYLLKAEVIQQENFNKDNIHVSGKIIKNGNAIKRLRIKATSVSVLGHGATFPIYEKKLWFYIGRLIPFDSSRFFPIYQYYKMDKNKIHFYAVQKDDDEVIDAMDTKDFQLPQDLDSFNSYSKNVSLYRNTLTIGSDGSTNFDIVAKKIILKDLMLPQNSVRSQYCLSDLFWTE